MKNTKMENIPYDLITKYLAGECSGKEKKIVDDWINKSNDNNKIFRELKLTWEQSTPTSYKIDADKALENVTERLTKKETTFMKTNNMFLKVAAGLILLLGIFSLIGKLAFRTELVTMEVASNEKPLDYTLPDGSIVTINSGSQLTCPSKFKPGERRINFIGEAYFDIAPDSKKPFIIESGNTVTRVLGTEFNFKTQADSIVRVIVTEGIVSLSTRQQNTEPILLEAGQVGEYTSGSNKISKKLNDDPNFLSWKNGILVFAKQDLETAISQISRHYNINIEIEGEELKKMQFTATFDNLTFDEVSSNLELILNVAVKKGNGNFTIMQQN